MALDWSPLLAILADKKRILITTHARPDGDALGSELALCLALRNRGQDAIIVNVDPVPPQFDFIGEDRHLFRIFGVDFADENLAEVDLAVIVDTSAKKQLPGIYDALSRNNVPLAVIDHHSISDRLTADTFQDATAPAAGCILMDFFDFAHIKITPRIAEYLFLAICTDTGWFRFPSMKSETFRQAARLMECGVNPAEMYARVNEWYPFARTKLIGVFASNATREVGGRVIYSWITRNDFQACGADYSETTDMVNLLLSTKGAEVAVAFMEHENGVRINFRSRSEVNVAEIAQIFGGGGHVKAAGAFMEMPLGEVIATVMEEIKKKYIKYSK